MQAIILAAGMGRRLGALTKDNTKCMIEVNGVKLIDRLLGQLSKLSLTRVVIVVGYKGQELRDYLGQRYDDKIKLEFIENPVYASTNNIYSLALAKDQLQQDDTLLIESDLIFEDRMFDLILNDKDPNVALVAKYETWMDGTMVRIDEDYNIVNFVPKKAFNYADKDSYYKTCNIYKFSKEFAANKYVPFLEVYMKALGCNEYYEQVLRVITFLDKSEVKALPITDEKWYEIDDIQDLDIAQTIFSSGEDLWKNYSKRFGGFWRFPQMLDFNYLVNPFFPSERMIDELEANFKSIIDRIPVRDVRQLPSGRQILRGKARIHCPRQWRSGTHQERNGIPRR
jgi:choline kinase